MMDWLSLIGWAVGLSVLITAFVWLLVWRPKIRKGMRATVIGHGLTTGDIVTINGRATKIVRIDDDVFEVSQ